METATRLAAIIPDGTDVVLCASSGISTRVNVERYLRDNADAVLVGEALVRTEIPRRSSLICPISPPRQKGTLTPPLIKSCGIRTWTKRSGVHTLVLFYQVRIRAGIETGRECG